uniref:Uncharacterized protein n=1 Tax=Takifugu rubripes TaxID=31033 RepID=A0A674MQ85_TAKRU
MAELLPLSKGEPSHPTEEAHFSHLYPKKTLLSLTLVWHCEET